MLRLYRWWRRHERENRMVQAGVITVFLVGALFLSAFTLIIRW